MFQLSADWTAEEKFTFNIDQYRKYLRSILALAGPHRAQVAFFIQPVPAIGKVLTDEEKRVVGPLDYGPLYQRMADALLELANERVPVFSLLNVFAEERNTLYQDPIHMNLPPGNARGYRIMAAAMADRIAEAWGLTRTCE
jgi:lysophospholipase L1-like esterase